MSAIGFTAMNNARKKGMLDVTVKAIAEAGSSKVVKVGLSVGGIGAASVANRNRIVRKYRVEHPNTELSYNEIWRNYQREHLKGKSDEENSI